MTRKITTVKQALEALKRARARSRQLKKELDSWRNERQALDDDSVKLAIVHEYLRYVKAKPVGDEVAIRYLMRAFEEGEWDNLERPAE